MRQYNQIKQKYPDTVLLFRLGDFFETFGDDAVTTANACGITLTKRNNGAAGDMPLAGFPHHQLDAYLPKLVKAGYRVAVCDQLEDPKLAKGIVRRGVVEVVTPGAALYDKLLDSKRNNYLATICHQTLKNGAQIVGFACIDISTGEFIVSEFEYKKLISVLENFQPSEIIINKAQKNSVIPEIEKLPYKPAITKLDDWMFETEFAKEALIAQFETNSLKGFGIENFDIAIAAAGAAMRYVKDTQTEKLSHINSISIYDPSEFMTLDFSTRRNLEITFSNSDSSNQGALINILDKTLTPMGSRALKKWMVRPLLDLEKIRFRLDIVDSLVANADELFELRQRLKSIGDIERLVSKISSARANPRDIASLKNSVSQIAPIKEILNSIEHPSLSVLSNKLDNFEELIALIDSAIIEEPSTQIGSGNIFKKGYSATLDEYIYAKHSGKQWINEYQERERSESSIPSLKVGFNNVFGYYIEITRTHSAKAPEKYERKQTLANAERYTTPELKEIESKILGAEEKISEYEQAIFTELRLKIALYTLELQKNSEIIAALDCLQGFAHASAEYGYVKPEIDESDMMEIIDGRHPSVERLLPIGERFIPNSTSFSEDSQIHIITGPNMAGKSCYLRQVGLIVLLGQIGCFVPAKSAKWGLVDRIFTRVGAQDNISAGESTFLVEMQEAANILNNAGSRSLILLDEIGRGTATFDGISIAWAMTEYIHDKIGAKTLFATHYHELNELADEYDRIENFQAQVIEKDDKPLFSHKIAQGAADHSFGIYVAKMAGAPKAIIERANEIMRSLEAGALNVESSGVKVKSKSADPKKIPAKKQKIDSNQISIFEIRDDAVRDRLRDVELENITPFQALELLREVKELMR
jgi:DNA mismatch repair protein MutS